MKKLKVSLILNSIIVFLVILMNILMLAKIHFMKPLDLLVVKGLENYKFYTADSNVLIGIISLIFIVYLLKLKNNKIKEIPKSIYILKMVGTICITITFIVTLCFLAPMYGFYAMFNNCNLFFHLIIPLLSIITYVFFEKHDNKYKYAVYGIIPMFIYGIFYIINVLVHLQDEGVTFKYDFYGFLQGNINNIYFAIPIIFLVGYLISLLIVFLNKKFAK
jgi:hypothetical protein